MSYFKRCFLLITAIFIGFALSGCATMTNSLKSIDANTNWIEPSITADLDVSPNKIVGIASGGKNKLIEIRKVAMLDALVKHNSGKLSGDIADLIVEPTYFYEYDGLGNVKVTVIGYPAKYKNFKTINKLEIPSDNTLAVSKNNNYSQGECFNRERGRKRIKIGAVMFCFWGPFSTPFIVSGIRDIRRAKKGQCD